MALRKIFQSTGPTNHIANTLQLNAVRLADIALGEYSAGREAILAHAQRRGRWGIMSIFQASWHFESCIWAVERFVRHIKALRSEKFVPADMKLLMPRNLRLLHAESQIVAMRDMLAHLEKDACRGELNPETALPVFLAVNEGLCVGACLTGWQDIKAWLEEVHKCASALANY